MLALPVGEQCAFAGDAFNVGVEVAHHSAVVGADVEMADIIAQDDQNVRLLAGWAVAAVVRQVVSAASRRVRIRMTLAPRLLPGSRGLWMVGTAG